MNYTIPKDRQQAIEIYNDLRTRPIIFFTKYDMFIGALTECSDDEFNEHTKYHLENEISCTLCKYDNGNKWCKHSSNCKNITKELFSKRWNE